MLRVVLDTNVLLSGLAYPASLSGRTLAAWRDGAIELLLSPSILDEWRRVLPKLAHRHRLSAAEIEDPIDVPAIQATTIGPIDSQQTDLRDPKDHPLLGTPLGACPREQVDYCR